MVYKPYLIVRYLDPQDFVANTNRVALNSKNCWEYGNIGLNSAFGMIILCPGLRVPV